MRFWVLALIIAGFISRTRAQTEEERCNFDAYRLSVDYEVDEGLEDRQLDCEVAIDNLKRGQFGPPSQYMVFSVLCKSACRSYSDRLARIESSSDCRCNLITTDGYGCQPTPTDLLCSSVEFCYDSWEEYKAEYCASDSCGRFAESEDDWRTERAACGAFHTILPLTFSTTFLLLPFLFYYFL